MLKHMMKKEQLTAMSFECMLVTVNFTSLEMVTRVVKNLASILSSFLCLQMAGACRA